MSRNQRLQGWLKTLPHDSWQHRQHSNKWTRLKMTNKPYWQKICPQTPGVPGSINSLFWGWSSHLEKQWEFSPIFVPPFIHLWFSSPENQNGQPPNNSSVTPKRVNGFNGRLLGHHRLLQFGIQRHGAQVPNRLSDLTAFRGRPREGSAGIPPMVGSMDGMFFFSDPEQETQILLGVRMEFLDDLFRWVFLIC